LGNGHCDIPAFGRILDESWQLKRGLASTISNDHIDKWYQVAKEAGATGGKVCGAGGGGFVLFVVSPDRQEAVREALRELKEIRVRPESHGSRILIME
jgi:D-glycero-alpha-D-manno-heptose-7-phosphate kinase